MGEPILEKQKPLKKRKKNLNAKLKKNLIAYSFLLPGLSVFYLFIIYPLLQILLYSVFSYQGIGSLLESKFIGLDHFVRAFSDERLYNAFKNTVVYTMSKTFFSMIIAFLLAYFLYQKMKGWRFFQLALFIPAIVPLVVSAIIWKFIFNGNFGVINQFFELIGLEQMTRFWLSDPNTAMFALIVAAIWAAVPFKMIILFTYMLRISKDLLEVARLEGAGALGMLRYIIIPLMIPAIILLSILSIASDFEQYEFVLLFTAGGPVGTTTVAGLYAFQQAFDNNNFGYASAVSILIFIALAVISLGLVKNMRKNVHEL